MEHLLLMDDYLDRAETCECADPERCCYQHGKHVEPHRRCILR